MSGTENKAEIFTITEMVEPAAERETKRTSMFEQYVQPCLAELYGTTLFVFVGCASVMGNIGQFGVLQPAMAHGLALAVLIMLFGKISGGHFNPAVSVSVYLCGGMKLALLLPYILAQMLGGLLGAALTRGVFPDNIYNASFGGSFLVGPTADLGKITLAEVIMTLFLTLAVCMGAVNKKTSSPVAAFCIGLTVSANILAGGQLSGACMNPVRAFGPAAVAGQWGFHWIFWAGPLCGALITVVLVRLLLGDQVTRVWLK
ncbi:aquaporin-8a.1 [Trematomus bernacchii]|uniref:aquaporin-8a.1 n=1 Tax=Trematomus bernacchii TaxID=40690 RepID=UPI00146AF738|nr:aquaporin-8a.1 [Trematomus bernacchii]